MQYALEVLQERRTVIEKMIKLSKAEDNWYKFDGLEGKLRDLDEVIYCIKMGGCKYGNYN
ncbi:MULTISPECIES: hypothetical protein [Bacillus cereus group]|uniref:hypothetical protein n=1 Tax=Bacillus cereus group TaxID=86661 RepID=UPI000BF77053|nr:MULTISPECIES: hypothetical protein [Bacillus cereus group]PGA25415.1 hypothetical protein COL80_16075 [Bacillus thuringiensis]PGU82188.1 hypothetical protein COD76_11920 [Bacillus cereus]